MIVLKLRGLFYKIGNDLRLRHVFRDGGSTNYNTYTYFKEEIVQLRCLPLNNAASYLFGAYMDIPTQYL